jgi:hypothetical protein
LHISPEAIAGRDVQHARGVRAGFGDSRRFLVVG